MNVNKCELKGTKEWNTFVGEQEGVWRSREKKEETSVAIFNPPMLNVYKDIRNISIQRYGSRKSEYLLIEYGYDKFCELLDEYGLNDKFRLVRRIKRLINTPYEIPEINLKFYEVSDKQVKNVRFVYHMSSASLHKINSLSNNLGFSKVSDISFA